MHNTNFKFLLEGALRAMSVFILLEYMTSSLKISLPWLNVPIFLLCTLMPIAYSCHTIFERRNRFCSAFLLSTLAYVFMIFSLFIAMVSLPEDIMIFPRREMSNAEGIILIGVFGAYTILTAIVRISLFGIVIRRAKRDTTDSKRDDSLNTSQ